MEAWPDLSDRYAFKVLAATDEEIGPSAADLGDEFLADLGLKAPPELDRRAAEDLRLRCRRYEAQEAVWAMILNAAKRRRPITLRAVELDLLVRRDRNLQRELELTQHVGTSRTLLIAKISMLIETRQAKSVSDIARALSPWFEGRHVTSDSVMKDPPIGQRTRPGARGAHYPRAALSLFRSTLRQERRRLWGPAPWAKREKAARKAAVRVTRQRYGFPTDRALLKWVRDQTVGDRAERQFLLPPLTRGGPAGARRRRKPSQ